MADYRDELGAARAKVEALEARVRDLEGQRSDDPPSGEPQQGSDVVAPPSRPPRVSTWSPGNEPTTRDVVVSVVGALVTGLVLFAATIAAITARHEGGHDVATWVFAVTITTTFVAIVTVPRAFVPMPVLNTRSESGDWDGGWRLRRRTWVMLSVGVLVTHAVALAVG